jgi:hypothetical protein
MIHYTDALRDARADALHAYQTLQPDGTDTVALSAAIDAYEQALIGHGVIPSGDLRIDAPAAARRLAEASGSNLFAGDNWQTLLHDPHRVRIAFTQALSDPAAQAPEARAALLRDREILLAHIQEQS